MFEERFTSLCWRDSESLKLPRRERAGETARLILESRALVAIERDCNGATLFEARAMVSCKDSNFLSIFSRFESILAEACRRVLRSEHADSSLAMVESPESMEIID